MSLAAEVESGNWGIREGFVGAEMCGKRLGIAFNKRLHLSHGLFVKFTIHVG